MMVVFAITFNRPKSLAFQVSACDHREKKTGPIQLTGPGPKKRSGSPVSSSEFTTVIYNGSN